MGGRQLALIAALGLTLAGAGAGAAQAQGGRTAEPRAGETVLNCADGGWDVAGGSCQGRGGVIGQQVVGDGVVTSRSGFSVQPNAIFSDPSVAPTPRTRWTDNLPRD